MKKFIPLSITAALSGFLLFQPETVKASDHDEITADLSLSSASKFKNKHGSVLFSLTQAEISDFWDKIFEREHYAGPKLNKAKRFKIDEDGVILDIGANIGLFTLWAAQKYPQTRIMAFEPIPPTWACAEANRRIFNATNAVVLKQGVSDKANTAIFTYLPLAPAYSTMFTLYGAKKRKQLNGLIDLLKKDSAAADSLNPENFKVALSKEASYACKLTTVEEIFRIHAVDKISLMKISSERSELAILKGVGDKNWGKIDNIVIQVEDNDEILPEVVRILEAHDFEVIVEKENDWFSMVFAIHK